MPEPNTVIDLCDSEQALTLSAFEVLESDDCDQLCELCCHIKRPKQNNVHSV